MPKRLINRAKFQLERLMLRGARYRLLVIGATLGLLSYGAGLLVYLYTDDFPALPQAVWWAFLRLTDPGYLGDDEGTFVRVIATVLTVLGFVIFVGALIAILTQWLNQTIEELEEGHTPVSLRGHIVILGWTNRTAAVVRELILSEGRVKRFLARQRVRGLKVAILADQVRVPLVRDLRERLGTLWSEKQVILRSGIPLRMEHLRKVDFPNAATVLLPAGDFRQGPAGSDTVVIKTLLSIANHPMPDGGAPPPVVAEIFDTRKLHIARSAYPGKIELLSSDAIISRLIAQNVRHPGLSSVYRELLTHGVGNEIYIRRCPELAGRPARDVGHMFPDAILLGIAREHGKSFESILNPPQDLRLTPTDGLVLLARRYEETEPSSKSDRQAPEYLEATSPLRRPVRERRVLILGWSHRVPALLLEFDGYGEERFTIDLISALPISDRERYIDRYDARPERIRLGQIEGDYTSPSDLRRLEPANYDNIILIGSDWLESGEEADARTILGYLLLRDILPAEGGPEVLVELLDPGNLTLFRHRPGEVLISPLILSHMLAQVALRPELRAVFDELFGSGGAEISFIPALVFGDTSEQLTFRDLERRAFSAGQVAIGVRLGHIDGRRDGGLKLNPPKNWGWAPTEVDEVVVLTAHQ